MKIAYILYKFPVLSETFILNEIVELIKNNHDIEVFSLGKPTEILMHEDIDEYKLLEKTHYLSDFPIKSILKTDLLSFFKLFLRSVRFDIRRVVLHPRANLKTVYFATLIKNFDIIHSHFATYPTTVAMQMGKITGKPFTFTAHAYDIFADGGDTLLEQKIIYAKRVITISQYNKKYLLNKFQNIPSEKIEVIHCGIDIDKFKARREEPEKFRIITVSRFVEKKGIPYLLNACSYLRDRHYDFCVEIIGDGPERGNIKNQIDNLNLNGIVTLTGKSTNETVLESMKAAVMFVLPCIVARNDDRDGIPVSLMEAMAMEIPVISTFVSGIPELVDDGKSGILVAEKDDESLAKAIIKLIENPELRQKMGKEGRKKILQEFDIKKQTQKLIEVFEAVQ